MADPATHPSIHPSIHPSHPRQLSVTSAKQKDWQQQALAAVSKELSELDLGDWNPSMAEAAPFLKKRDYSSDPTQLQIIEAPKPNYLHNFWLSKANQQFPLLAVAGNKLLSAHATTAASKRNWSALGRTNTSLRNRLNVETAEKLVCVKASMPKKWYS
eukprot:19446-Pelagomonas_calceolata.AAC.2